MQATVHEEPTGAAHFLWLASRAILVAMALTLGLLVMSAAAAALQGDVRAPLPNPVATPTVCVVDGMAAPCS